MMKSPLAAVAACFALGIVLARPEGASLPGVPLLLGCGLCLLVGLIALARGMRSASFLLALAGFVGSGAAAARLFEFRFPPNHVGNLARLGLDLTGPVRLEGRVVSTPFRTASGLQFDIEAKSLEASARSRSVTGLVRLRLPPDENGEARAAADALHLQFGDSIRALVRLRRPRVYQNPGSFNFRRWMESIEDLYWTGTIKSPRLLEKLGSSKSFMPAGLLEKTRRRLLESIDRLYPPWSADGRNGSVLKAVLLGERSSLDSDTVENFRKAGLYHLLVIAGLHVGLLAMLAEIFLRRLRFAESWRSAGVFLLLLGYAFLLEQRASTLRATIMIAAYLLARLFYRERAGLNAIGLAALLLLLDRPAWLFEAGFQLSFSAALLIVTLVVPILEQTTEPYRRAARQLEDVDLDANFAPRQAQFRLDLRDLVKALKSGPLPLEAHPRLNASLVTVPARITLWTLNILLFSAILQLGLLLPMAEIFHRVSYAGIGLNALAIPVMTVLLAVSLPAVILSAILPALGPWLAKLIAPMLSLVFRLTELPNLPVWLSYRVPEPPRWVALGFALSVVVAAWSLKRHARVFWASLGALPIFAILISLYPFRPRLPQGGLEITALDCGAGDAFFVVLPDQTSMLVDACGSRPRLAREGALHRTRWNPGEEIISPYLWSRGVKKIDIVLLTDSREGQSAAVSAVMRNFRVREFWQGRHSAPAQAVLDETERRGTVVRWLEGGDVFTRAGTSFHVLWPSSLSVPPGKPSVSSVASTDDSLVLRITRNRGSVLFPGDINGKVEEKLIRSAAPLESDVVELAPHAFASPFSTEFLARVSPRIVLVTAGSEGNRDPLFEALDCLRATGARIFRTDLDGAVTVELNGDTLAVHTYRTSAGEGTGADMACLRTPTFSVP